jgi:branched-subunit amino acid transport protein
MSSANFAVVLVGCAAVTYLTRIAGFYAGNRELSARTQRVLAYVPVGAFASIVALGVTDSSGELDSRVPALIFASILAYLSRPIWFSLVAGLAVYAGLTWAL